MIKLTPMVSRSKIKWYKHQKIKKFALNLQLQTVQQCSNAHYESFLFYYSCKRLLAYCSQKSSGFDMK